MSWMFLSCVSCLLAVVPQQELAESDFTRLHAELQPAEAAWRTIPWQTSLLEAQRLAAKEGKPIFIWSMDGNPLGCT